MDRAKKMVDGVEVTAPVQDTRLDLGRASKRSVRGKNHLLGTGLLGTRQPSHASSQVPLPLKLLVRSGGGGGDFSACAVESSTGR